MEAVSAEGRNADLVFLLVFFSCLLSLPIWD